jgi:hypothetical protein
MMTTSINHNELDWYINTIESAKMARYVQENFYLFFRSCVFQRLEQLGLEPNELDPDHFADMTADCAMETMIDCLFVDPKDLASVVANAIEQSAAAAADRMKKSLANLEAE